MLFRDQHDEAAGLFAKLLSRLEPGPVLTSLRQDLEALNQRVETYAAEPAGEG